MAVELEELRVSDGAVSLESQIRDDIESVSS